MGALPLSALKREVEALYQRYHHPRYRELDPVSVVWEYEGLEDQEIAGLWAALFAWGRRDIAIWKARALLREFAPSPAAALRVGVPFHLSWRHRTWSPSDMALLWERLSSLYKREGNLASFFWKRRGDWEGAIAEFQEVVGAPPLHRHIGSLRRGSASKRLLLWLRWMIRRDCIDPGPWEGFSPQLLFMPLDIHVSRWAVQRGLLSSLTPNWKLVRQLTEVFRQIAPEDPLRYDFAIVTAASQIKPSSCADEFSGS